MLETTSFGDSIFAAKHRPVSVATEFMEDWEVDDDGLDTEIEDDGENSPRVSLNSVSCRFGHRPDRLITC